MGNKRTRRNRNLMVRMNDDEMAVVERICEKTGATASAVVRMALLRYERYLSVVMSRDEDDETEE